MVSAMGLAGTYFKSPGLGRRKSICSGSMLFHPAIRFVQGLFNHPQNKKEPGFFNPGS